MELAPRPFRLTTAGTLAVFAILVACMIAGSILYAHVAANDPVVLAEVPPATINLGPWLFLLGATIWAAAVLMWGVHSSSDYFR